MKIAFISDIHSNIYALEAVLSDIDTQNISEIYGVGDIVGYHSLPNEVIKLLKDRNIKTVQGNHDYDIANEKFRADNKDIKHWTYLQLSRENIDYLQMLPTELALEKQGVKIRLTHGSLQSMTEYLFEDSDTAKRDINSISEDILICGHTHFPYVKRYGKKLLINTGSVGKPKIGEPKPNYIILEITNENSFSAEIKFVNYEYHKAAEDMRKKGLSEKIAKELELGKVI